VTLLKERYGDTQKLTDAHMQALVELKSPNHTLNSLQLFYDSIESHIRSLQSLGTPPEMYESMLVPTILTKLPAEIRRTLAKTHSTEKWTLKDLRSCLLQELRILDVGADYTTGHQVPTAAFSTSVNHKLTSNNITPNLLISPAYSASHPLIPQQSVKLYLMYRNVLKWSRKRTSVLTVWATTRYHSASQSTGVSHVEENTTPAFAMPRPLHKPCQQTQPVQPQQVPLLRRQIPKLNS